MVFFEGVAADADVAAIKKALLGMGADAAAKEILKHDDVERFHRA